MNGKPISNKKKNATLNLVKIKMNKYFSNPELIDAAKEAIELMENDVLFTKVVKSLRNAVIKTELETEKNSAVYWREEMCKGRTKLANKGKLPSGHITGYVRNKDGELTENDDAPTIALIFDLYMNLENLGKVSRELVTLRLKTRRGINWSRQSILNVLTNPIYCGKGFRYQGKLFEGNIPKIVTTNKWNKVQKILKSRSRRSRKNSK